MLESILYVEDEETSAQMLCEVLDKHCENLYFAPNGKVGHLIFTKKKLNLIITDINMPVMDGIEMIKKIREENQDISIICTTSYEKDIDNKLAEFNILENIKKPIDVNYLISLMQSLEKKQ